MSNAERINEERLRAQLEALNQAAIAITAELGLERVLQRIADMARDLAGARYAALGVPDAQGGMEHFVFSGITPEQAKRVGQPPRGEGMLGLLLREPDAIRVADIAADPRAAGFPVDHPAMRSFLGMPIKSRGKLLGNLYLTDKIDAPEFGQDDERLIGMLAMHAAIAIDNARLVQETLDRGRQLTRHNRELEALNAVGTAASQSLDLESLLRDTLDKVLAVMEADAGEIFLREESSGDMVLAVHRGLFGSAFYSNNRFERNVGFPGIVAVTGEPLVTGDLYRDARFAREEVVRAGIRSFACIPLTVKNQVIGALTLAARNLDSFEQHDLEFLTAIGQQIGVAVENARLYSEVKRLAVIEERARIGMELHDGVIQSIYAVGLALEYASLMLEEQPQVTRERLAQSIDGLNEVIRDLRSYILDLRPQRFEGKDLATGLLELVRAFRANTFVSVELAIDQQASEQIEPEVAMGLFHIAQEGLANVAKHARARGVKLSFDRVGNTLVFELKDDGRGFDPQAVARYTGHGMRNMEERARLLNGEWRLDSAPGKGTHIQVTIPIPSQTSA